VGDYAVARRHMIDSQLRPNRVSNAAVLAAMAALPRELFVPTSVRGVAYVDEDLPLGGGRHLMEPLVVARLLQEASIAPTDVALDVGCGSGYDAAVLARLASTVVALECDAGLAESAGRTLADLAIDNVAVVEGDLAQGYPDQAPYDVIFISGAVADVPKTLLGQLGEGGRLVTVIAGERGIGRAVAFTRAGGVTSHRTLFDAAAMPLPGFDSERGFVF
jgi:protein-L-isoaspartate(D-aspartate) O-methyltransferase